ncbi:MAG: alpha/beta hydrolase [Trueperaceae bacterium]|nr:MAG: alpha/beta hydrolase [Trueperaceae bacterium]
MPSLLRGSTPAIRNGTARSIASLERVTLGGDVQWLTLRGHDAGRPLLLYVHGGPGTPDLGAIRHFMPELEERFLVAHWCQRGGGKSYSRGLSADRMTMAQFVADLEELSLGLLQRFGQRKLFLVGHSWGTALGMRFLARRPDLVAAYVGVNQVVDRAEEELRSYRACLSRARERDHRKAVAQLEALGEPRCGVYGDVAGTLVQRGWIRSLGLVTHEPQHATALGRAIAMSSEVTVRDLYQLFARLRWNMELLWPEFCGVNLAREVPAVDVPVVFITGEHDRITSPELAHGYLEALRAPEKAFFPFPRSGHAACFEEPGRFLEVMSKAEAMGGLD